MAKCIESRDCSLPAFSHSPVVVGQFPQRSPREVMATLGSMVLFPVRFEDETGVLTIDQKHFSTFSLLFKTELDPTALAENGSFTPVPLGFSRSAPVSIIASNGVDKALLSVATSVILYHLEHSGSLDEVFTIEMGEDVLEGVFVGSDEVVVMTKSGKGFKLSPETKALPPAFPSSLSRGFSFISSASLLVPARDGLSVVDLSTGRQDPLSLSGFPEDIPDDLRIQGLCRVGETEFGFVAASPTTMDAVIGFGSVSDSKFVISEYSLNEIFITAEWSDDSFGVLSYVPEMQLLIAGHSLSDSAALFSRQSGATECLLMPEGKQLTCSLINGDASSSFLMGISVIVLDKESAIQVPRNNDLADCRLLVVTGQLDGWFTIHYGEVPTDWKWLSSLTIKEEAKLPGSTPANSSVKAPVTPAKTPGLLDSTAKAPEQAKPPGMFNPVVKAPEPAKPPGLFDSSVKAPETPAKAPGLFDATVKAPEPAKAPGVFNATVKAPEPAKPPGPFDSSVKAPETPAKAPGLFDATVKAPQPAKAPGILDATVKAPEPAGAKSGLFNASVSAAPTGSLFGSFGAAPSGQSPFGNSSGAGFGSSAFGQSDNQTGSSGFGTFGQQAKATAPVFGLPKAEEPKTTAPVFGAFGQPKAEEPKTTATMFGALGLPKAEEPKTAATVFGAFGQPKAEEPKTTATEFGAFGQPKAEEPKTTATVFGALGQSAAATGGLFGEPKAEEAKTSASAFGTFGQSTPATGGGIFGQKEAEEPKSAAPLFGHKQETSKTETKSAFGAEGAKPASPEAKGLTIEDDVIEAFEKELKLLEANAKNIAKSVPKFNEKIVPENAVKIGSLEAHRDELLRIRDEVRKFDSEVREMYVKDPRLVMSEDVSRLESKFSQISAALDEVAPKIPRPSAAVRSVKQYAPVIGSPSRSESLFPKSSPTTTHLAIFRPLPPSMRREPAGGLSSMTPIKPSPNRGYDTSYTDIISEPTGFRRRENFTPRPMAKGKRMSLGELITGKILSSPQAKSRPVTPELAAPPIAPSGGHGAAWRLLRQIEAQQRELENILRAVNQSRIAEE